MDKNYETMGDLQFEISSVRNGKNSNYIENLIIELSECDENVNHIEKKYHCGICVSVEKHNQLQLTYYYEITSNLINANLYLEIESGINNGTQFNSYSFSSSVMPKSRTIEVLKDIVLNKEAYIGSTYSVVKAQNYLNNVKSEIMQLFKNQNCDNYVTGGGTDNYYKNKLSEYKSKGLFFSCVYEEIEVDLHLV